MIALAYAVPTGVMAGWAGVLDMVLTPAKVNQVGKHTHKCFISDLVNVFDRNKNSSVKPIKRVSCTCSAEKSPCKGPFQTPFHKNETILHQH